MAAAESIIAREIRLARKRLKMNQAEFARAIEASQGSVSKWESGREVPRLEAIERISQLSPEFEAAIRRKGEVRIVPVERYVMDYIGKAPLRGFFMEGSGLHPYEQPLECHFLIGREWEGRSFEAFHMEPRSERERKNGGSKVIITATFGADDRLDDVGAAEYLVSLSSAERSRYLLVTPSYSQAGEIQLWPSSNLGRRYTLPIGIGNNGRPVDPDCRIIGPVVCTLTYPREFSPSSFEPTGSAE